MRRCWGVFGCGWGVGQMATMLVMPTVARVGGFRAVFLTMAVLALLAAAATLSQRTVRALPQYAARCVDVRAMAASLHAAVKNPRLLLLGLTCIAHLAIPVGILVWTPSFLEIRHGASVAVAAYLTAGLGAAQILGNLAGEAAAGKWSKHKVIVTSLAAMTAAAAAVAIVPGRTAALAVVLIAGFCSFALFPSMIGYIAQVVARPEDIGAATGVHTIVGFVGALVAPWIFGQVLDSGARSSSSYLLGYLILALFGVAAVAGMALFRPGRLNAETNRA